MHWCELSALRVDKTFFFEWFSKALVLRQEQYDSAWVKVASEKQVCAQIVHILSRFFSNDQLSLQEESDHFKISLVIEILEA